MKIKTSELSGRALDWAVAKCLDLQDKRLDWTPAPYSADWTHGGPIIERYKIEFEWDKKWTARLYEPSGDYVELRGPTMLIAAMRALAYSRLGGEVEIPEGLL